MSRVTQSISQLLTTFGPGSMMDLPTRSVVVAGLDHWDGQRGTFKRIEEPRLQTLLQAQLVASGRWVPNRPLHLRTPPIAQETRQDSDPASVSVRIFPTWFTCEGVSDPAGGSSRRRRLVPWADLDVRSGRAKYHREDGLVEIAERIPEILRAALERMRLCSNDPVCADHDPSVAGDERSLHGAACHACLLVPETSGEARNVYLDRALLVETVAQSKAALFGDRH